VVAILRISFGWGGAGGTLGFPGLQRAAFLCPNLITLVIRFQWKNHLRDGFFPLYFFLEKGGVMANPDIVGRRIRQLRKARGLTQMELAEKANIPQSMVSQIESGARRGSAIALETARMLAFVLEVSLDALAGVPTDEQDPECEPAAGALVPA
jgi:DNA-binding XRE family transcriptional regulator